MTSTASRICSDCGHKCGASDLFCQCGALLDYTAPGNGNGHKDEKPAPAAKQAEWPPEAPYTPRDRQEDVSTPPVRVIHCPHARCGVVNPERLVICWNCKRPLRTGAVVKEPWSWRALLRRFRRPPLRPGQRQRERLPFFSTNPRALLKSSAIVLGAALAAALLVVGAVKGWPYAAKYGPKGFAAARRWTFPRFKPHHPSSVFPTRYRLPRHGESLKGHKTVRVKSTIGKRTVIRREIVVRHPAVDAFDGNLSTYWQSKTGRRTPDVLRVYFAKPVVSEFNDVVVFGGDPTAKTVVPRHLQMTFYTWEPHRPPEKCKVPFDVKTDPRLKKIHHGRGAWCVTEIKAFDLLNKPSEQRFSFPAQHNVGKITITVTGTHHTDNPKLRAAITEVEFFDRY